MDENWAYFIYIAVAATMLALFSRARAKRSGSQLAIVGAIALIIVILLFFSLAN